MKKILRTYDLFKTFFNRELMERLPSIKELMTSDLNAEGKVNVINNPGFRDMKSRENLSGRPIPNIRRMEIKLQEGDGMFLIFGIGRRAKPVINLYKWENGPANKYIEYMFKRIGKEYELGLTKRCFKSFGILMRSKAYRVSAFEKVAKNWHRTMPLGYVLTVFRKVEKMSLRRPIKIKFNRIYIPKGDSKGRPLGVPTLEGRIYLHMMNNIITHIRMKSESDIQHAYLPGRGVITAGEELVKGLEAPHIYEYDLKSFFDNVSVRNIVGELKKMGFPNYESKMLGRLAISVPSNMDLKLKEVSDKIIKANVETDVKGLQMGMEQQESGADLSYVGNAYERLMQQYGFLLSKGVPQGSPISCSLSTLGLRNLERRWADRMVAYSDDGIIIPYVAEKPEITDHEAGVIEHADKSGGVKLNGQWLKDLKFLGMKYVPEKKYVPFKEMLAIWIMFLIIDILLGIPLMTILFITVSIEPAEGREHAYFVADTRKGSQLKFTTKEQFLVWLVNSRDNIIKNNYTEKMSGESGSLEKWLEENWYMFMGIPKERRWKILFKSNVKGGIFSRMQSNDWNIQEEQNFKLNYNKESGIDKMGPIYARNKGLERSRISVFTSTSMAANGLLEQKNWYKIKSNGKPTVLLSEAEIRRREETKVRLVASETRVAVGAPQPLSMIPIVIDDLKYVGVKGVKGPTIKPGKLEVAGITIRKVLDIDMRMGKYNKDGLRADTKSIRGINMCVQMSEKTILRLDNEITKLLFELKLAKLKNRKE